MTTILIVGCNNVPENKQRENSHTVSINTWWNIWQKHDKEKPSSLFTLSDFFTKNQLLEEKVDTIVKNMSSKDRVAQILMQAAWPLGKPFKHVEDLVKDGLIGGVVALNGNKNEITKRIKKYTQINKKIGHMPLLYSADAEPSLINKKIKNTTPVLKANQIKTLWEAKKTATIIADDLRSIWINYNFAPVIDVPKNKRVWYRAFGKDAIPLSWSFIEEMQDNNIIATAKHFPWHGLITSDTHKSLGVIDGELKELKNYPPLIKSGVLSIMVGHIAVKNNKKYDTDWLPATCSKKIVTDLLRNELGFKGLIITDAMRMWWVSSVKNASILALKAGSDIVLMPKDIRKTHQKILAEYVHDDAFRKQVDIAVRRIVRMKICLWLIK